jgi:hypothetical protein
MTHQVHEQLADESGSTVRIAGSWPTPLRTPILPALQLGAQHLVLRPNHLDRVGTEREAKRRPTPA